MIENTKLAEDVLNIELQNEKSEQTNLQSEFEKNKELKGIVVFMYPKADTPGCTEQAKLFKEKFEEITNNKYALYGLSADTPEDQLKWKEKLELPFGFLCDVEKKLLKQLDCLNDDNRVVRSHMVVQNDFTVTFFKKGVKPGLSAENVLNFLTKGEKDEGENVTNGEGKEKEDGEQKEEGTTNDDVKGEGGDNADVKGEAENEEGENETNEEKGKSTEEKTGENEKDKVKKAVPSGTTAPLKIKNANVGVMKKKKKSVKKTKNNHNNNNSNNSSSNKSSKKNVKNSKNNKTVKKGVNVKKEVKKKLINKAAKKDNNKKGKNKLVKGKMVNGKKEKKKTNVKKEDGKKKKK
ncbi:merozoite capping protein 1, putative [Plasmodium ovale curtisi]|uniref:Merozoite capping protein 1, putative n=1 Tax=Plasmodium ovale curtisi TaxID=864141 RepID=A0A1A8XB27_PLAOA|nr:merozoite capping protein 1, putative [Plasmodium ovale curtisi]